MAGAKRYVELEVRVCVFMGCHVMAWHGMSIPGEVFRLIFPPGFVV